ncbi:outer membrane beta-barrel family protein [Arundinibacter roseus]|uniref:TonB-dependent receptor n=1 Tax=Arundinibacter roseus TaxID=2070510 RepID=A0A4V2XAC7_9BACT|nr:outer membrane beta-barrel family protein [Arundinibacter roseus]TDB66875.1 TonB-dependent receptor [Arundinibacter roseus]
MQPTFTRRRLLFIGLVFFLVFHGLSGKALAQKAETSGRILDAQVDNAPLSFASIRLFKAGSDPKVADSFVAGAVADEKGNFVVQSPYGSYFAMIEFLGYKTITTNTFTLTADKPKHDLGTLKLETSANSLDEVVVQAEKSSMELSLDKRIFNVGKDLANAGGSATEILSNIPSVSVDPEGNVKLRGSGNVRILIDGKPSGLVSFKGGSGLQQLQGSLIERVEIITNPSARYEAEGMAGIINIVLKKERKEGFNGSFEVITGQPVNYGGAANLNYRHRKVNFFINYGIAYRIQPGRSSLYQEVYTPDTTFYLQQSNKGRILGFNQNIRGGLDFFFTEKSILTASYLFRRSDANRITDIEYQDFAFTPTNLTSRTFRRQDEDEVEPNSEYVLSYKREFARKDHNLTAEVRFLDNWERSDQLFTQRSESPGGKPLPALDQVQHSLNDEFEKQLLFQLDYIQPLGKEGKFESGLRSSFRDMVNDFVVNEQNEQGQWEALPNLKNYFIYNENIHAAYGILGNKTNKLSYQVGLRAEWTDVKTTLRETGEVNPRKYANLFPSAHFTYDLPQDNAMQLSYSRRVRRPVYNDLSPFMTFSDSRNFFSGNPNLNPEFSHVMEFGHIKYFEKGSFTSSVYYRITDGKIERIRQVGEDGFSITLPQNLLSENSYGIEFTSSYSPVKWWKNDFNFNFFHATIDGSNILDSYKTETYSWFVRQTSRFTLAQGIDMQLRANFEAPQKTAQGTRKALFYADFAMSKDVFKGQGTLNLAVLDVFNSRRFRSITEGPNFYTVGNSQMRLRQINLTLNYRINQVKTAKKSGGDEF